MEPDTKQIIKTILDSKPKGVLLKDFPIIYMVCRLGGRINVLLWIG